MSFIGQDAAMLRFTLFILLTSIISGTYAMDCQVLPDDCEYYVCQEMQRDCGDKGYLMNFGHKYCQEFLSKEESSFSENGRIWLRQTRSCLMRKIDEIPMESSCKSLKRQSFKDHVPCYIESGFCQLERKDKLKIISLIKKTWFRPSILWAGLKVLNSCYSPFKK